VTWGLAEWARSQASSPSPAPRTAVVALRGDADRRRWLKVFASLERGGGLVTGQCLPLRVGQVGDDYPMGHQEGQEVTVRLIAETANHGSAPHVWPGHHPRFERCSQLLPILLYRILPRSSVSPHPVHRSIRQRGLMAYRIVHH